MISSCPGDSGSGAFQVVMDEVSEASSEHMERIIRVY